MSLSTTQMPYIDLSAFILKSIWLVLSAKFILPSTTVSHIYNHLHFAPHAKPNPWTPNLSFLWLLTAISTTISTSLHMLSRIPERQIYPSFDYCQPYLQPFALRSTCWVESLNSKFILPLTPVSHIYNHFHFAPHAKPIPWTQNLSFLWLLSAISTTISTLLHMLSRSPERQIYPSFDYCQPYLQPFPLRSTC